MEQNAMLDQLSQTHQWMDDKADAFEKNDSSSTGKEKLICMSTSTVQHV